MPGRVLKLGPSTGQALRTALTIRSRITAPDRRGDDRAEDRGARAVPEEREQEAGDERARDAHDDVHQESLAVALDDLTGEPTGMAPMMRLIRIPSMVIAFSFALLTTP